jgi:hypothetical protein
MQNMACHLIRVERDNISVSYAIKVTFGIVISKGIILNSIQLHDRIGAKCVTKLLPTFRISGITVLYIAVKGRTRVTCARKPSGKSLY